MMQWPSESPSLPPPSALQQPQQPSLLMKAAYVSSGILLATLVILTMHIATSPTSTTTSVSEATKEMMNLRNPSSAATSFSVVTPSTPASSAALSTPHRSLLSTPTAHSLLESDVLAAGGKPLSEDATPCGFSFHSDDTVPYQLAVTVEPTWDISAPASNAQNVLEFFTGLRYSYTLSPGLQYAWSGLYSPDKPQMQIWPRFLGWQEGEVTLDALNQRHGEGSLNVVYLDHRVFTKMILDEIETKVKSFGVAKLEDAPPTIFTMRKPQEIDSQHMCHSTLLRTLRQKYCAARAIRPVPITLYASAPDQLTLQPKTHHHAIHIGVQLMSSLEPNSGTSDGVLGALPSSLKEYADAMSLTLVHLLTSLRRVTYAPIHIHLFSDPPITSTPTSDQEALFTIQTNPLLRDLIMNDMKGVEKTKNEGVTLHNHFALSSLHAFHHLVLSDILIAGWNAQSLLLAPLNEGLLLIPDLPKQKAVTRPPTPFYDLPVCDSERTIKYAVRMNGENGALLTADKQLQKMKEFFATPAEASTGATSSTTTLLTPRFELPQRRLVRRRYAEASVLTSYFTAPEVTSDEPATTFNPNALMMRHCQAIPLPHVDEQPPFTIPKY